jgi:hypothetical protein
VVDFTIHLVENFGSVTRASGKPAGGTITSRKGRNGRSTSAGLPD